MDNYVSEFQYIFNNKATNYDTKGLGRTIVRSFHKQMEATYGIVDIPVLRTQTLKPPHLQMSIKAALNSLPTCDDNFDGFDSSKITNNVL